MTSNEGQVNQARQIFGHLEGIVDGHLFESRMELSRVGLHPPPRDGIAGNPSIGCFSIVLSGVYDNQDDGDVINYSGENPRGGNDSDDQLLNRGNLALKVSHDNGLPVRVTRGSRMPLGPTSGYRYDGLYKVVKFWRSREQGRTVWRYRLDKLNPSGGAADGPTEGAPRRATTLDSIVRDGRLAEGIKKKHDYRCQVCSESLPSPSGVYAEAAHIQPLGTPDDGPDIEQNLLCLCPNHHKLLDKGGIIVDDSWQVVRLPEESVVGELRRSRKHALTQEYLSWHRARWTGS